MLIKNAILNLVDIRKLLLVYRLRHYNEPLPDVGLTIQNRDKQLCKPLIRLFQNTEALEILESLSKLLIEKNERKAPLKQGSIILSSVLFKK